MNFRFYRLGETSPCLAFSATGVALYDQMCAAIVEHVLGADPYSETAPRDLMEIVAMQTPDEAEYVEAVFIQGHLVGSMDAPFALNPNEYAEIRSV